MTDAKEAAERIVAADDNYNAAPDGVQKRECAVVWRLACQEGGTALARAYLDLQKEHARMREAVIEECAKVADRHRGQSIDSRSAQAALNIAVDIRALKEA